MAWRRAVWLLSAPSGTLREPACSSFSVRFALLSVQLLLTMVFLTSGFQCRKIPQMFRAGRLQLLDMVAQM